jgi:hypothetical protein
MKIYPLSLVLLALALAGCASTPPATDLQHPPGAPSVVAADQTGRPAAESSLSLKEYLTSVAARQYASSEKLTSPPPRDMVGKFYMELNREPARLILASGVAAFASDGDGLAIGFEDGVIRTFGSSFCPSVALPGKNRLGAVAWSPQSPLLVALGAEKKQLFLYDLRSCQLVGEHKFPSPLADLTISPQGSWIAGVVGEHGLVLSPSANLGFQKLGEFRYATLAMQFTPREGVLMVFDNAGWLTLWAPLTGKRIHKQLIPGGPFLKARFDGRQLFLTPRQGNPVSFNVASLEQTSAQPSPASYQLENGVLSYRTSTKLPVKKLHMSPPVFRVFVNKDAELLMVEDMDGEVRHYDLRQGRFVRKPTQGGVWTPVAVSNAGEFTVEGRKYALAAKAAQWEHLQLNCRSLQAGRFLLWWSESPRPAEFDPHPGMLPVRESLLAESPLSWTPIEPSKDLL